MILRWEIDSLILKIKKYSHFQRTELSPLSRELDKKIQNWFQDYKDQDKKEFINNLDTILKKAKVTSILDIKEEKRKIWDIIYQSKDISDSTKKTLQDFLGIMITSIRDTKKEEIKSLWSNLFKIKKERH